jgi:hypothetical protein
MSDTGRYRFFHPPLCPGAPPVERPMVLASRVEVVGRGFAHLVALVDAVHDVADGFLDALRRDAVGKHEEELMNG